MDLNVCPYYRILFKYTSRSRPKLFYRGLLSIIDNCNSQNYQVLCSLDQDDPTLPEYLELIAECNNPNIQVVIGTSSSKVSAINRDLNDFTGRWDILVNMSDDMIFTQSGFDDTIRREFGENLDQFIHFNDGLQNANLSTMTIEGRQYYERFGYIYFPEYQSLWCDVEAQDVAKKLGKYKYAGPRVEILKHLHPAGGLAQFDEQYRKTEDRTVERRDHQIYTTRKASGFSDLGLIQFDSFKPKFSILIATLASRRAQFLTLLAELTSQVNQFDGQCEILWHGDNGELPTGTKRNRLMERANGEYLAFFDDDDWPSARYVSEIMEAVSTGPDCCSLLGEITVNGQSPELFEHSLAYSKWRTNQSGRIKYERTPNHLNPVRSSIAKGVKFPEIKFGEDHAWSDSIVRTGLLKTESKISNVIYHYRYSSRKTA